MRKTFRFLPPSRRAAARRTERTRRATPVIDTYILYFTTSDVSVRSIRARGRDESRRWWGGWGTRPNLRIYGFVFCFSIFLKTQMSARNGRLDGRTERDFSPIPISTSRRRLCSRRNYVFTNTEVLEFKNKSK